MIEGLNYHQVIKMLYYLYSINSLIHYLIYDISGIIKYKHLNYKHQQLMELKYQLYQLVFLL